MARSNVHDLLFRQVHLDYHMPDDIPDLAADFDPEAFGDAMAAAHVDSVTCFARCHNGWLYYDSSRFPERVHPRLTRPKLLDEQIAALHVRGIRAPFSIHTRTGAAERGGAVLKTTPGQDTVLLAFGFGADTVITVNGTPVKAPKTAVIAGRPALVLSLRDPVPADAELAQRYQAVMQALVPGN